MHSSRPRALRFAVLPLVAVLAACGGGSTAAAPTSGASSPGAVTSSAATSAAAADPAALLADAIAAMKGADSTHMKGTFVDGASTLRLDIVMVGNGDADATIGYGAQGTVKIRTIGPVAYVSGDDAFWTSAGLPAQALRNKWIRTTKSSKDFAQLVELTQLSAWADQLRPDGTLTVVAGRDFDGVATVGLDDGTDAVMYVAAGGDHHPVALVPKASSDGMLTFTEWNAAVSVAAPPAASVVTA